MRATSTASMLGQENPASMWSSMITTTGPVNAQAIHILRRATPILWASRSPPCSPPETVPSITS